MSQFAGSPYKKMNTELSFKGVPAVFYGRRIFQKCRHCRVRFFTTLFNDIGASDTCIECLKHDAFAGVDDDELIDRIEERLDDA